MAGGGGKQMVQQDVLGDLQGPSLQALRPKRKKEDGPSQVLPPLTQVLTVGDALSAVLTISKEHRGGTTKDVELN